MTRFDADTALEPVSERRWRGEISDRWYVGKGANGGLIAALAVRALQEAVEDPGRAPRSLTLHFLEAPAAGPIEVAATVERDGRSTTAVSLRMEQGGRPVALGLAALATWREGEREHLGTEPAAIPRPDELEPLDPDTPGLPAFVANYDWRWGPVGAEPRIGGWIRTRDERPVDAISVAAFADAFPPAVFPLIGWAPALAPTIDLTIHFRAPLAAVGTGWVLATFVSRRLAGGYFEEDGELWSEDGVLLAQSRQLAMLRLRSGEPAA